MSSNLVQTTPSPTGAARAEEPPRPVPRPAGRWDTLKRLLKPLASLRLTVVLFVLSIVLVFFGTLAQINNGIWTVVGEYFRSFWVWIPYQLAVQFGQIFFGVPKEVVVDGVTKPLTVPGAFPFPGGWLLGSVLLVNLLAAHLVRFKLSWKRSGILLIHGGLILMMLGELITGLYAVEGNMVIFKGQSSNYLIHPRFSELAILDRSDPKYDEVVVIPDAMLKAGSPPIRDERLPFDVRVDKYMKNSDPVDKAPKGFVNPADAGRGVSEFVVELPEGSGAETDQRNDFPSAYVTFLEKGSEKPLGTYLMSLWFTGEMGDGGYQPVRVGDKTYEVGLRFKRSPPKPYQVTLLDFQHKKYEGTEIAKDFRSTVRLVDAGHNEDFRVDIYMNHPLRYRGETFYQHQVLRGDSGTVLQVVRNPGWLLPYFSCVLVAFGMIVHFGMSLDKFLERQSDGRVRERAARARLVLSPVLWVSRLFGGTKA